MLRLIVATRNAGKKRELVELLRPHGIEVVSLAELDGVPDVVEDGATFAENAEKKAVQTARFLQEWVVGEDSGLAVDALDGAPGVYSARYSGPDATDAANNSQLIDALRDVPDARRGAAYVCHIALADPSGDVRLHVEDRCRGRITPTPRGAHGFGYDPYFLIREYHRTFGELSPLVKSRLSHRGRAVRQLLPQLLVAVQEQSGTTQK